MSRVLIALDVTVLFSTSESRTRLWLPHTWQTSPESAETNSHSLHNTASRSGRKLGLVAIFRLRFILYLQKTSAALSAGDNAKEGQYWE